MPTDPRARSASALTASGLLVALATFGPGCTVSADHASSSASAMAACDPAQPGCLVPDTTGFQIRAYAGQVVKNGGKCLDYASDAIGAPLVLNDCATAHPLRVVELPERMGTDGCARKHEVALTSPSGLVVGIGTATGGVETPLELQAKATGTGPHDSIRGTVTMAQRFSLDGDSIIVAADREGTGANVRVAKVQNSRGKNSSPIVVGPRELRDNELWDFHAVDESGRDPTTGFVHVNGLEGLRQYFHSNPGGAHQCARQEINGPKWPDYDTVVVVDDAPIIFATTPTAAMAASAPVPGADPILVTDGVTIRGDRRGTRMGPALVEDNKLTRTVIDTLGNDIRITGLRFDGPTRSDDGSWEAFPSTGIHVQERDPESVPDERREYTRLVVDHNDMSEFVTAAVRVDGGDKKWTAWCTPLPPESTRPNRTQVSRNFIHHDRVDGSGYGVNANSGGFPRVEGNTFVQNRHSVAATNSSPLTGYRAHANLVLSSAPIMTHLGVGNIYTHDFDIHGTGENGFGGIGGGYTEVGYNTFLGHGDWNTWRANFKLRGMACDKVEVHDNVFLQSKDEAVQFDQSDGVFQPDFYVDLHKFFKVASSNKYDQANPTKQLATGDFDGDGRTDLFLATGAAWYYAPGGEAEWRVLSPDKTDAVTSLLFGDFDGDGRTDVVGQNGANALVSWGGVSEWEYLNFVPPWRSPGGPSLANVAVGNFDGVGGDDLFFANGEGWYVAAEGSGAWVRSGPSSFRVRDVRFGDFNGNGTTDVFAIVSGKWMFSDGTTQNWAPLPVSLTSSSNGLFVADFDGNGTDDIGGIVPVSVSGTKVTLGWRWSKDAAQGWQTLLTTDKPLAAAGRFRGQVAGSALLFWDDTKLDAAFVGSAGLTDFSRQDMR